MGSNDARRRLRAARIAEGLCVECTAPTTSGGRCDDCAGDAAARGRAHYAANAERIRQASNVRYHAQYPEARRYKRRRPMPETEVSRAA